MANNISRSMKPLGHFFLYVLKTSFTFILGSSSDGKITSSSRGVKADCHNSI